MNTTRQATENMEYVRRRLGIPWPVAEAAAGQVDWHQMAALVRRGCPPWLALRILR